MEDKKENEIELPPRDIYKWNTPDEHLHMVKMILKVVTDILDELKICYWLDGGSLLGAYRDNDIIGHDDDADICIFEDDFNRLKEVEERVKKMGIGFNNGHHPLKMTMEKGIAKIYVEGLHCLTESGKRVSTPGLDLFTWKISGNKIVLSNKKFQRVFQNCFYRVHEVFPLKKYQFGEIQLWGPNKPEGYLKRYYGKYCMVIDVVGLRNETGQKEEKLYFDHKTGKELIFINGRYGLKEEFEKEVDRIKNL